MYHKNNSDCLYHDTIGKRFDLIRNAPGSARSLVEREEILQKIQAPNHSLLYECTLEGACVPFEVHLHHRQQIAAFDLPQIKYQAALRSPESDNVRQIWASVGKKIRIACARTTAFAQKPLAHGQNREKHTKFTSDRLIDRRVWYFYTACLPVRWPADRPAIIISLLWKRRVERVHCSINTESEDGKEPHWGEVAHPFASVTASITFALRWAKCVFLSMHM